MGSCGAIWPLCRDHSVTIPAGKGQEITSEWVVGEKPLGVGNVGDSRDDTHLTGEAVGCYKLCIKELRLSWVATGDTSRYSTSPYSPICMNQYKVCIKITAHYCTGYVDNPVWFAYTLKEKFSSPTTFCLL